MRDVHEDIVRDDYEDIDQEGYREPKASDWSRDWNRTTEYAGRHSVVTPWHQQFHCESTLELKTFLALMGDRRVRHVREQPPFISLRPDHVGGEPGKHTVDMVATMVDGTRVAILVKPRAKAKQMDMATLLRKLAEQAPVGFADSFVHVHEGHLTKNVVRYGALALMVLREGPFPHDAVVGRMAEVVATRMSVREAVVAAGMPGAFRAVVRLIVDGRLRVVTGCVADLDAVVEPVSMLVGGAA